MFYDQVGSVEAKEKYYPGSAKTIHICFAPANSTQSV